MFPLRTQRWWVTHSVDVTQIYCRRARIQRSQLELRTPPEASLCQVQHWEVMNLMSTWMHKGYLRLKVLHFQQPCIFRIKTSTAFILKLLRVCQETEGPWSACTHVQVPGRSSSMAGEPFFLSVQPETLLELCAIIPFTHTSNFASKPLLKLSWELNQVPSI